MANGLRNMRQVHQFLSGNFPKPLTKIVLRGSDSVKSELIASLNLYSEVKSMAKELLNSHGHKDLNSAFFRFQAFMRQGRIFYEAAEVLPPRASPLNFYYAFMNFAKACIVLHDPNFCGDHVIHGLSPSPPPSTNLRKQYLTVKSSGVFPLFYRLVTRKALAAKSRLKIVDLFAYTQDVRFEFETLKYGTMRSFSTKFVIGLDTQTAFSLIAVMGTRARDFDKLRPKLLKSFCQVDLGQDRARNLFGIIGTERAAAEFFESKAEYPIRNDNFDISRLVLDVVYGISDIISYDPFPTDVHFLINQQIKTPRASTMNETLAIYCCMFFLGSLVRYRPDILERMLMTKDAWLIERFIKSSSVTFLRHLRNLIDGRYLAYGAVR